MRVFVYGSLMWDEWASAYAGERIDHVVLPGYRRSFNKASTVNWGSRARPCPTLGLEPDASSSCRGTIFEFPEDQRTAVLEMLRKREGRDFTFAEVDVRLPSGSTEIALVPMNDRHAATYLGDASISDRSENARLAQGSKGKCLDYVANIQRKLNELGIIDPAVEEFYRLSRRLV